MSLVRQSRPRPGADEQVDEGTDGRADRRSPLHVRSDRRSPLRVLWPALLALVVVLLGVALPLNALITVAHQRYQVVAMLKFTPASLQSVGSDTMGLLTPRYAVVARSSQVLSAAAAASDLTVDDLRRSLRVTVPPGTLLVELQVSGRRPEALTTAANALARAVLAEARSDRLLVASLAAPAVPPVRPVVADTAPLRFALWAGAAVLALVVADAVASARLRRLTSL
jgi:capsular polysaccharide biosynthesis protein